MPLTEHPRTQWLVTDAPGDLASVLELIIPGRWDAVADVYGTLHNLRTQVIYTVIRYIDHGSWLRYRLHLVEFDGARLDERRRREIVERVECCLLALPRAQRLRKAIRDWGPDLWLRQPGASR